MKRLYWGILGSAGAAALALAAGCSSDDEPGCTPGEIGCDPAGGGAGGSGGGSGNAGSGGGGNSDLPYCANNPEAYGCTNEGACFPTDTSCYLDGMVGDECLAQRDNSVGVTNRIQYRQTWGRPVSPVGLTNSVVYDILRNGAGLPGSCTDPNGVSGWLQLLDTDLDTGITRTGYAKFIADEAGYQDALTNGLCMIQEQYIDPLTALTEADMSPRGGWGSVPAWPEGLPDPMPMPWNVRPLNLKRRDADFTVSTDRETLIAEAHADASVDGWFYLDEETGYNHGFVIQAWTIVYTDATTYAATPIREVETVFRANDPQERSCIGSFRGADIDPSVCDSNNPEEPNWGCPADDLCEPGTGPANIKGYFLITELEQVRTTVLNQTYCVLYPGSGAAEADGFAAVSDTLGTNCRESPNWDPKEPVNGLPSGDWCAATNSAATDECHDAFRVENWQTFQAFPVADGTCGF